MNSIFAFLFISLFNINFSLAMDENINLPFSEPQIELSKKEKLFVWLHSRHSPGHLKTDEHDVPAFFQFKPSYVPLPESYRLPEYFVVKNQRLDLRAITPQTLERLSDRSLKTLLDYLSNVDVQMLYSDEEGNVQSGKKHAARKSKHWENSNAASALVFSMGVQSQTDLFVRMTALAPDAVISSLKGKLVTLMNPEVVGKIITHMILQLNGEEFGLANPMTKTISALIQQGLPYWVGKNENLFDTYLATILTEVMPAIDGNDQGKDERTGLLIGSVLSSIMKHIDAIREKDEKRIWFSGLIANLAWAATTFIGCAPLAAPVVATVAGTISVGAVLSAALLTAAKYPRNYTPKLCEILGSLEMSLLEAARKYDLASKVNFAMMYFWLQASIHSNGLKI